MWRFRREFNGAAKTAFRAGITQVFLTDAAIVPDFRGCLGRYLDQSIVGGQGVGVALLREQQVRQVGQRHDFARPPCQHFAITMLGSRGVADAIELGAEIYQQPGVPREDLQGAPEDGDGPGGRVMLGEQIAEVEQRFTVARIEFLCECLLDERCARSGTAGGQGAARFLQKRIGARHR